VFLLNAFMQRSFMTKIFKVLRWTFALTPLQFMGHSEGDSTFSIAGETLGMPPSHVNQVVVNAEQPLCVRQTVVTEWFSPLPGQQSQAFVVPGPVPILAEKKNESSQTGEDDLLAPSQERDTTQAESIAALQAQIDALKEQLAEGERVAQAERERIAAELARAIMESRVQQANQANAEEGTEPQIDPKTDPEIDPNEEPAPLPKGPPPYPPDNPGELTDPANRPEGNEEPAPIPGTLPPSPPDNPGELTDPANGPEGNEEPAPTPGTLPPGPPDNPIGQPEVQNIQDVAEGDNTDPQDVDGQGENVADPEGLADEEQPVENDPEPVADEHEGNIDEPDVVEDEEPDGDEQEPVENEPDPVREAIMEGETQIRIAIGLRVAEQFQAFLEAMGVAIGKNVRDFWKAFVDFLHDEVPHFMGKIVHKAGDIRRGASRLLDNLIDYINDRLPGFRAWAARTGKAMVDQLVKIGRTIRDRIVHAKSSARHHIVSAKDWIAHAGGLTYGALVAIKNGAITFKDWVVCVGRAAYNSGVFIWDRLGDLKDGFVWFAHAAYNVGAFIWDRLSDLKDGFVWFAHAAHKVWTSIKNGASSVCQVGQSVFNIIGRVCQAIGKKIYHVVSLSSDLCHILRHMGFHFDHATYGGGKYY
jgi:hypothetical protein